MTTHREMREIAEKECKYNKADDFYIVECGGCRAKGPATAALVEDNQEQECKNCDYVGCFNIIEHPIRQLDEYLTEDCRLSDDLNHLITQRLSNLMKEHTGLHSESKFAISFKRVLFQVKFDGGEIDVLYDNGEVSWDAIPSIPVDLVLEIKKLFK